MILFRVSGRSRQIQGEGQRARCVSISTCHAASTCQEQGHVCGEKGKRRPLWQSLVPITTTRQGNLSAQKATKPVTIQGPYPIPAGPGSLSHPSLALQGDSVAGRGPSEREMVTLSLHRHSQEHSQINPPSASGRGHSSLSRGPGFLPIFPLDRGVRTEFNLSLTGKWPSFTSCYINYTLKKDGYNLTKWQKVENEQRRNPCLLSQSTGCPEPAGCSLPESLLGAYRCVSG